jgi:ribosome-binding factor A
MPSPIRQKRVADRIQAEISALIQQEMNDPRLALVSVTRVNIDRELAYANVFVSTVGDEARQKEVLRVLNGAKGFIRREIGHRVRLRNTPQLVFHWDPAPEKGEQISQLLDQLREETSRLETRETPDTADDSER